MNHALATPKATAHATPAGTGSTTGSTTGPTSARSHGEDLRGVAQLAVTATTEVANTVEAMHRTIASGPAWLGLPLAVPAAALTQLAYAPVLAITRAIGAGVEFALAQFGGRLGASTPGAERDAALAALNGVVGDHLKATDNPLAIRMHFRVQTERAAAPLELSKPGLLAQLPGAGSKLLVLVHGSSMNSQQWQRRGHDHGAALARDCGFTPVYLDYNSGLHVSDNGEQLAAHLELLVANWPTEVSEICVLAHSMGGLVARSACQHGELNEHAWRRHVKQMIFLGTPHHGAPLERGGNVIDVALSLSDYSAPIGRLARLRSAGVTDLRFGNVRTEDCSAAERFAWSKDSRTPLALPVNVACYAIAGTLSSHKAGKLLGDGLVPVASALGEHANPRLSLDFPASRTWVAERAAHLDLLSAPNVYAQVHEWLTA
jgi:pimeloyl-ACP methyl ester carboxylesterase